MAGYTSGVLPSMHGMVEGGASSSSQDMTQDMGGGRWYFLKKELEEDSPSRTDGINLKKETYLRKSYCTFLQELGIRLKVPQVTIATAIIFCHRFFLRQSHAKNDRWIIATVCMFLAGKVEETPRPLKDVILVSYEIIHKKDPAAAQRIKQKEVYEQQKELILLGERLVLATLGFDLNVHHPYKPLVEAIKKFKVAQNALAQVAWNFVNDGKVAFRLRTALCLQFKSHHIAAGAIFLAAKFLKVKLPSDGEKVWWQEFDVTPRQLEEVSNQMLELYEQNRAPPSQGSEVEGSIAVGSNHRASEKSTSVSEEQLPANGRAQSVGAGAGAMSTVKSGPSKQLSSLPATDYAHADNYSMLSKSSQNESNDNGSTEMGSVITDHKVDGEIKDKEHSENVNMREGPNKSKSGSERTGGEDRGRNGGTKETTEAGEWRDNGALHKSRNMQFGELGQSPQDAIKMIDKVKAALEKRKKSRGDRWKRELMNEDDIIEKELEEGIELAAGDEKTRQERRQGWSETENEHHEDVGGGNHLGMKGQTSRAEEVENVEKEEMVDDALPILNNRKRRGSPLARQSQAKR